MQLITKHNNYIVPHCKWKRSPRQIQRKILVSKIEEVSYMARQKRPGIGNRILAIRKRIKRRFCDLYAFYRDKELRWNNGVLEYLFIRKPGGGIWVLSTPRKKKKKKKKKK